MFKKENHGPKRGIYHWGHWIKAYLWGLKEDPATDNPNGDPTTEKSKEDSITEESKETLITEKPKENTITEDPQELHDTQWVLCRKQVLYYFLMMVYGRAGDNQ